MRLTESYPSLTLFQLCVRIISIHSLIQFSASLFVRLCVHTHSVCSFSAEFALYSLRRRRFLRAFQLPASQPCAFRGRAPSEPAAITRVQLSPLGYIVAAGVTKRGGAVLWLLTVNGKLLVERHLRYRLPAGLSAAERDAGKLMDTQPIANTLIIVGFFQNYPNSCRVLSQRCFCMF
jgi:hypothetical protein